MALIASGCSQRVPARAEHVVIVTLDTTRADYLTPYGSSRATTPNLDRVARAGVVFEQATTVAPLTLTAHCSVFTGLLPPHHGVRDNGDAPLAAQHATLAEMLHSRGFRTAAFVGSAVLQANRGLARGFDVYHDGITDDPWSRRRVRRPADEVVDDALDWLEREAGSPLFLWVHLYDAHAPYDIPAPYRGMYSEDPYAGAIAFADAQVGRLLDALERRGFADRTAVVVAADHGEAFGEHGERGHGIFIYQEVLRVPLIVKAPGVTAQRIGGAMSLVDIVPTMLDLVGASSSWTDGVNLAPFLRGTAMWPEREIYAESLYPMRFGRTPLQALRGGRFKFIDAPRPELYDLELDPSEQRNLAIERSALALAMDRRLSALDGGTVSPRARNPLRAPSADVRERLAALGYISSRP
jgi:arylsulfatase A-like enzyme